MSVNKNMCDATLSCYFIHLFSLIALSFFVNFQAKVFQLGARNIS